VRAALLAIAIAACDRPAPSAADAGPGDAAACAENPVPLLAVDYGGTSRWFVAAVMEGRSIALQLDTGSSLTFLYQGPAAPDYTPDVATIAIGCETISADGRNLSGPSELVGGGLEVVGLLGMDYLLERPTLLDTPGLVLTRFRQVPETEVAAAAYAVAFDDVIGHALVPCRLDGVAVRLMFDTGAGDTLWVGQEGRPGDQVVQVQDAEGTIFPVYVGDAELTLPGRPATTIPIARAPAFPYFEETIAALGGNLHGLLGVSAFPGQRLLFLGSEARFHVID
jgi:hypothetical protein